jgi:hypothetical protein
MSYCDCVSPEKYGHSNHCPLEEIETLKAENKALLLRLDSCVEELRVSRFQEDERYQRNVKLRESNDALRARLDSGALFAHLVHGDDDHQRWLREALEAYMRGEPRIPPYGKGITETLQERLSRIGQEVRRRRHTDPACVLDEIERLLDFWASGSENPVGRSVLGCSGGCGKIELVGLNTLAWTCSDCNARVVERQEIK